MDERGHFKRFQLTLISNLDRQLHLKKKEEENLLLFLKAVIFYIAFRKIDEQNITFQAILICN